MCENLSSCNSTLATTAVPANLDQKSITCIFAAFRVEG
jgi:hypothetical protein